MNYYFDQQYLHEFEFDLDTANQKIVLRSAYDTNGYKRGVNTFDLSTGEKRYLGFDGYDLDFHPDSGSFVYVGDYGIMKCCNSNNWEIVTQMGWVSGPKINRNGDVVFGKVVDDEYGKAGLWKINPDHKDPEFLFFGGNPAWHPLGIDLLYTATQFEVYIMNTNTLERHSIMDPLESGSRRSFYFSTSGNRITYIRSKGNMIVNSDGSESQKLLPGRIDSESGREFILAINPRWLNDEEIIYAYGEGTTEYPELRGDPNQPISGIINLYKVNVSETIARSNLN